MPHSWIRMLKFATATALLAAAPALVAQVILTSDNQQDAYTRIQSKLASALRHRTAAIPPSARTSRR